MSARVERTLRLLGVDEPAPNAAAYWRKRSAAERLAETLKLHREGNELFRGGNPPFSYEIRTRHVGERR